MGQNEHHRKNVEQRDDKNNIILGILLSKMSTHSTAFNENIVKQIYRRNSRSNANKLRNTLFRRK